MRVRACVLNEFVHFLFIVRVCFFSIDFLTGENESRQNNGDSGSKNCICNDNQCICCLDFNISFIDLGGPGESSPVADSCRNKSQFSQLFQQVVCA